MKRLVHPATIIAAAALFMAVGGGAYAAAQKLISGAQIKNHSIPESKLTSSAITALQQPPVSAQSKSDLGLGGTQISSGGTVLAALNLKAGSYVVSGKTTIGDYNEYEATNCFLFAPDSGHTLDEATYAADPPATTFVYSYGTVSLEGTIQTTGTTVKLECASDVAAAHVYANFPHLIAVKVGSVTAS